MHLEFLMKNIPRQIRIIKGMGELGDKRDYINGVLNDLVEAEKRIVKYKK